MIALDEEQQVSLTGVTPDDYMVVLYRSHPEGWVAEVPAFAD